MIRSIFYNFHSFKGLDVKEKNVYLVSKMGHTIWALMHFSWTLKKI